ncbi:DNA-directed RNA polymerase [Burkholderia phage Bp-AMP4]|uniref:DNA-directed RNA polymerase n=2 Tax=Ampunavirus BpAMP1 TaxID=2733589 RepID=A0A0A8KWP2_9CAUD|nr:DNA-directed RNA polymerase [Burkholderia phage Bp-AMP4]
MTQAYEFVGPFESPQRALEREISREGRERALRRMEENEQHGRAEMNPYARPIYRRYLLPLIDAIRESVAGTGKAGRRKAHVALLKPLDPAAVAFIAVRTALVSLLNKSDSDDARVIGRFIGVAVYNELVFSLFENANPELYWEIVKDIERRNSTDARYKYRIIRDSANKRDMELPDWSPADREQVGLFLIEQLRLLGMVEVEREHINLSGGRIREKFTIDFTDDALGIIGNVKNMVELTTPLHLPFIEPPKPWTAFNRGGYHTDAMRRLSPYCISAPRVKKREVLDIYRNADLTKVRAAINKLQSVRWQINSDMLDTVREIARYTETEEVLKQADIDPPARPEWLPLDKDALKFEDMTEQQQEAFKAWKRRMRDWHNAKRSRGTKFKRFYSATSVADRFKGYDAIYFMYQADFRGRLYAVTTGVSPQGSDLQKCLLRFADGKPLADADAVRWFKVNGANRFGVDKVPFDDRVRWVDDNDEGIVACADDPVSHDWWRDADSPLQFLAWAKEYAAWRRDPANFVSRIPVGMDGSCNGLQHFSAMLRDEVGGRATNLLPGAKPNDIYQQVADVVTRKLAGLKLDQLPERDQGYAAKWISHGMNRKLVKRSVMTLPYGSTRFSCAQFIVDDYLKAGVAPQFEQSEYRHAANFLSHLVWDSIGQVVVAASAAMSWLQKCASTLIRRGASQIRWSAPSGFPVVQVYNKSDVIAVNSLLLGGVRIKVGSMTEDPDVNHHKNGMAPNFVHSMDAAHLTLTVNECDRVGIDSLAMIHDDYGTHAADAQRLFEVIRDTFVRMYEQNNPLAWFRDHYDGLPEIPKAGSLDIEQVRHSPYFFA